LNDWLVLVLAFLEGLIVSFIYSGHLWLTIRGVEPGEATTVTVVSFLVRLGVTLFGFYLILLLSGWQGFIACAAGFLVMRLLVLRYWIPKSEPY
jgi:F1F0 ATPase subunit 2